MGLHNAKSFLYENGLIQCISEDIPFGCGDLFFIFY